MAITWTDIENGESGLSVRTKLNSLGDSLATESTSINDSLEDIETDIDTIQNSITSLETNLETINTNIDTNTASIESLDTRVTTNETSISDIQATLSNGCVTVLEAYSTDTTQNPTSTNNPLQINFGSTQIGTDVMLSTNGTVTFVTAGTYMILLEIQVGRIGGQGESLIYSRSLLNDVQYTKTHYFLLDDEDVTYPYNYTTTVTVEAGDTWKSQIYRDSTGNDSGGLVSNTPTLTDWETAYTSSILIKKMFA